MTFISVLNILSLFVFVLALKCLQLCLLHLKHVLNATIKPTWQTAFLITKIFTVFIPKSLNVKPDFHCRSLTFKSFCRQKPVDEIITLVPRGGGDNINIALCFYPSNNIVRVFAVQD